MHDSRPILRGAWCPISFFFVASRLKRANAVGRPPAGWARVGSKLIGSGNTKVAASQATGAAVGAAADDVQILQALLLRQRPEGFAAVLFRGVARKRKGAGDNRRGNAGAARGEPAAVAVAVIYRSGPSDGRNIVGRPPGAAGIVLPRRFGDVRRAAAAGVGPNDFTINRTSSREERATHRDDAAESTWFSRKVGAIAGGSDIRYARSAKGFRPKAVRRAFKAVVDNVRAQRHGFRFSLIDIRGVKESVRFDQIDRALRTGGRDHLDVEVNLKPPARFGFGVVALLPVLVVFIEFCLR